MHRPRVIVGQRRASATVIAALVALLPAVAGCSADTSSTRSSNENGGYPEQSLFGPGGVFSDSARPVATAALPSPDGNCPVVSIRDGAGTISVDAGPKGSAARALRYEGSIGSTLRECALVGTTIRMKVAVHGHLTVRPAGRGGQVDVPMRYTIVQQGPQPKTIVDKLVHVPVAIAAGRTTVDFSSVADDLIIPLTGAPTPGEFAVSVGFDRG
jgi:hypothetical protein